MEAQTQKACCTLTSIALFDCDYATMQSALHSLESMAGQHEGVLKRRLAGALHNLAQCRDVVLYIAWQGNKPERKRKTLTEEWDKGRWWPMHRVSAWNYWTKITQISKWNHADIGPLTTDMGHTLSSTVTRQNCANLKNRSGDWTQWELIKHSEQADCGARDNEQSQHMVIALFLIALVSW